MSNFGCNITFDDVMKAKMSENDSRTTTFNPANYLDTKLPQGVSSRTLRLRFLPYSPEGGGVFHKVFMHLCKVDKEVSASGWKSVPCLKRNGLGESCPFCDTATRAFDLKKGATTQAEQDKYNEIGKDNIPRVMWVVRVIDRDHEEDGVKFWMFNDNRKGEGIKDKLISLAERRHNGPSQTNIFDLENGKDIEITIRRSPDGKRVYDIADAELSSPLTEDVQKGIDWINDEKVWSDLWKPKTYDYMDLLVRGKVPYYSKADGTYVDKADFLNAKTNETEARVQQYDTKPQHDLSTMPMQEEMKKAEQEVKVAQEVASTPMNLSVEDDDLPF